MDSANALGYGGAHFRYRERSGKRDATAASLYGLLPVAAKLVGFALCAALVLPVLVPAFVLFPEALSGALQRLLSSDPGAAKAKAFAKLLKGFRPNGSTAVKAVAASVSGKAYAEEDFACDYDAGLGITVV